MAGKAGRKRASSSSKSSSSKDTSKMWNSKKKKTTTGSSGSSSSTSNNVSGINDAAAEKLFFEIADTEEDMDSANMEGIFVLGEKLGMDATEDIRILVLLWKMGCGSEKPAQISKQEWMQGCAKLEVDSWEKLQKLVPSLDTGFLEQTPFKDFYKFCFQFNRQGTHKTLDKELAIALMKLVLKDSNRIPAHRLDTFCSFLQASAHSHITLDEWTLFLDFCFEYTSDDLSSYDESTSAWPVLFDEYVEYIEKNHGNGKSGK